MKRTFYILSFFSIFSLKTSSQVNVVVNPSFEQYRGRCIYASLNYNCAGSSVTGWYEPTASPVDWFNSCNNVLNPDGGVPLNYFGYQNAHSGDAYSAIGSDSGNLRVYITGQFSQSLSNGKKYCVNFYVSHADSDSRYVVSAMGAFISDTAPCIPNYFGLINCIPQVENPLSNLLTNTNQWAPISGEFTANGGEEYITLGDFYNDSLSKITYFSAGGNNFKTSNDATYYLDDVSVREIYMANAFNGIKDTTICAGNSVLIGEDTAVTGVTYQWLPTVGLSSPNFPKTLVTTSVTTTYTLIVHNDSMRIWNAVGACHCPDTVNEDSVTITVPTLNNICCDTSIFSGQSVELSADGGVHYIWQPTGGGCDTCPILKVSPTQTTTYSVTTIDNRGCTFLNTLTVDVSCPLFIPGAFSPNEKVNNILYVRSPCISSMDFIIFDRWGNKMFESQNQNLGWDGTYKSQVMNAGTYVYGLKATMKDGTNIEKHGNITLIR